MRMMVRGIHVFEFFGRLEKQHDAAGRFRHVYIWNFLAQAFRLNVTIS